MVNSIKMPLDTGNIYMLTIIAVMIHSCGIMPITCMQYAYGSTALPAHKTVLIFFDSVITFSNGNVYDYNAII